MPLFGARKSEPVLRLKLCPLINNPCLQSRCMMFRRTVTGAGYCGLASRDAEECFKLEWEDAE